jgi:hypothetical protein
VTPEQAVLISKGVGAAVNLLAAFMGAKQAAEVLDGIRTDMVANNRGPEDHEIETLMSDIQARSDRIQGSGPTAA